LLKARINHSSNSNRYQTPKSETELKSLNQRIFRKTDAFRSRQQNLIKPKIINVSQTPGLSSRENNSAEVW